ncbi:MAG: indole-3-glycerol phosphate synthase TrpC [Chloroflexi bacterium]|nr:indole-3-glycerol phosphate synthase TrpC [Chloroflexota bacterium]
MTTGAILDQILETKRAELARRLREEPLSALETRIKGMGAPLNLAGCLMGPGVRLIAEVKRSSPSRGVLKADIDAAALARTYAQNGAAAISVLTEADHFRGSLQDLLDVKAAVAQASLPVLRKDFLYDPYQVYEARAYGADAVLLIVAMLDAARLKELLAVARSLWLQALVEVHSEAELHLALDAGAEIIGVNHRDLKTFQMDVTLAERLRPLVPRGKVLVAESGINSRDDVARMRRAGVNAILVGEALVTAPDTAARVRELAGTA